MALKVDYVARETATNLVRNFTLTIASILTVAVSLSLVGASLLLSQAVDNATQQWQNGVEFIVFFQPEATEAQIEAVGRKLDESPQVRSKTYVDTQETLEEFKRLFKSSPQLVDEVSQAPEILPTSYRVVPVDKSADIIRGLKTEFESQAGVREVVAAFETIRTIQDVSGILQRMLFGIAMSLLVAAMLLIFNSIRMAMFARRREIEVMKLVGASNWFIRVPFMLEGVVQGLIGSGFAFSVILILKRLFDNVSDNQRFQLLAGLTLDSSQVANTSILVVVTGVAIGAVGSALAVRRFLDV